MPVPVSVVVISKNEPALDDTLTALEKECGIFGGECIVVDASEQKLEWIREKHPWVVWIEYLPKISGASSIPEQRNIGVSAARGEIIAFCDSGGIPEDGWLESICEPIRSGEWQYGCGPVKSTRPGVYRTINDAEDGEVVDSPPTANVAFTRKLFDQVGGFDERYSYGSDVDFAWRCAALGEAPRCSKKAVMGMDWGPWALQKRRSWRYGRARARLCRIHRGAWRKILRTQPEIVAYPGIMVLCTKMLSWALIQPMLGPGALGVAAWSTLFLRWRNRHSEQPWAVMLGHIIYGWAFWFEAIFGPRWKKPNIDVIHSPIDKGGPYVANLTRALTDVGVEALAWEGPTKSATINLLLAPVLPFWWRWRGARIWHLHWTWGHTHRIAQTRAIRWVERIWFTLHLRSAKLAGISLVWTAHNLYPHTPVFDDDRKARTAICKHAGLVIAHDEEAKAAVLEAFGAKHIDIIEQGNIEVAKVDREEARKSRGVGEESFVILGFGKIAKYKGYHTLLDAISFLSEETSKRVMVRIIGESEDNKYLAELKSRAGENLHIEDRYLSEHELAEELAAADVCAFLFENSLNSSTRKTAGRAGKPAIVRGGGGARAGETLVHDTKTTAEAIENLYQAGAEQRQHIGETARATYGQTWTMCAVAHSDAYRRMLGRRKP